MTAGELIEYLQEFDPKTRVLVKGYEGGFDDIEVTEPIPVLLNVHTEWWYGKHDRPSLEDTSSKKPIEAILIKGR